MKKVLGKGRVKYIHVNQLAIRQNIKNKNKIPVISVKCGKQNYYGNLIEVSGTGNFIYQADKPILSCGARLVFKTKDKVTILN